MRDLYNKTII